MFSGNFWQEIKEKYPRAYNEFYFFDGEKEEDLNNGNLQKYNIIVNKYCDDIYYCDIKKFFDERGIIICVGYLYNNTKNKNSWHYQISYKSKNKIKTYFINNTPQERFWLKDEAKLEAVKKAFEIAEEMENKK